MKRYLITGASSGIGKACAARLLDAGNDVIAVSRTNPKFENSNSFTFIETDLSIFGSGTRLINELKLRSLLPLDGFIHCAGVAPLLTISENAIDKVKKVYEVNVLSFVDIMSTLKNTRRGYSKRASVIALSSVVSLRGSNRQSLYAGTKAALEEAVRFFSNEFLDDEVRVNAIVSGAVRTEMLQRLETESPGLEERLKSYYPLGVIPVDEIWKSIDFLLSDLSLSLNGIALPVDSGYLL